MTLHTTHGFPYVENTDALEDYPATSEELAEAIDDALYGGGITQKYVTLTQFGLLVPYDGQEVFLVADATNGVVWHMRYNAASGSAYKWEYVGGPGLYSEVVTDETSTTLVYAALATAGPSLTTPRPGDYEIEHGANLTMGGAGLPVYMSYDIGGTAAVDADAITTSGQPNQPNQMRRRRKAGLAGSIAITAKYKGTTSGTIHAANRWMRIVPIRIS